MWRDIRSARHLLRATVDLLALEMRMLTGNRLFVLVALELLWVTAFAILQRTRDDAWDGLSFYNRTILVPALLPALALGMSSILGERDIRHLEMSFASPAGRYQAWGFRLAALGLACAVTVAALTTLTWVGIGQPIPPLRAALHAVVPILFVAAGTTCLSLIFNGAATGTFVMGAFLLASAVLLHGPRVGRFDLFINPFDPPQGMDPVAWFRVLVFNRTLLLACTGLSVVATLALLRRRERLL